MVYNNNCRQASTKFSVPKAENGGNYSSNIF